MSTLHYPRSARADARAIYPYVRRAYPDIAASQAILWARHEAAVDKIAADVEWHDRDPYRESDGLWSIGTMPGGIEIRVYADDEPYDWGDCEPTETEREDLEVIGVGVRITGDDDDAPTTFLSMGRDGLYHRHVGTCTIYGYGYTSGDREREAISCAVDCGMIDAAREELRERAYWRARGVMTVDA